LGWYLLRCTVCGIQHRCGSLKGSGCPVSLTLLSLTGAQQCSNCCTCVLLVAAAPAGPNDKPPDNAREVTSAPKCMLETAPVHKMS
jgi:hypothetical protein